MQGILIVLAALHLAPQGDRLPVPDPAQLKEKEKVIRDLFKADYAKKGAPDRLSLARTLIKQGLDTKDDPAAQYVLFREARHLAAQAGDLGTVQEAIEGLAVTFKVEAFRLKAAALPPIAQEAKTPELLRAASELLLRLTEDLGFQDEPETQEKLVQAALAAARKSKDVPLAARCEVRSKGIAELKPRLGRLKGAREQLAVAPDDPSANFEVGQFECLMRGNWTVGLPLLAKGSSDVLRTLALRDLSMPDAVGDQIALADAWKERSEKETLGRARLRERAAFWYDAATKQATGILRVKAEKALAELAGQGTPGARARDVSPQGLVGWWKLDEPSGTSAEDSSGQKNLGKVSGKAEWVPGHLGRAIKLTGAADRIVVTDAPSLRVTGDLTMSLWFRKDEAPIEWARMVGKGEYGSRNYGLWVGAGFQRDAILFQQWDGQKQKVVEIYSNLGTNTGRWTHVAAVATGEQASLYINGKLDQTVKRTLSPPATGVSPLTIGFAGWGEPFVGALDDVRIYSRALTEAEVEVLATMK